MGQKLPPDQMELYRRADEVLHYIWDPIGIADIPEARDEYYGYLPTVFKHLVEDANGDAIRNYLSEVQRERMELAITKDSEERLDRAVECLLRWKQILIKTVA